MNIVRVAGRRVGAAAEASRAEDKVGLSAQLLCRLPPLAPPASLATAAPCTATPAGTALAAVGSSASNASGAAADEAVESAQMARRGVPQARRRRGESKRREAVGDTCVQQGGQRTREQRDEEYKEALPQQPRGAPMEKERGTAEGRRGSVARGAETAGMRAEAAQ